MTLLAPPADRAVMLFCRWVAAINFIASFADEPRLLCYGLEKVNISAASRFSGRGNLAGLSLSAASLEFPCLPFSAASRNFA